MATHNIPRTTASQKYLRTHLHMLQGVALVRYDLEHRIYGVAGASWRTALGVATLSPSQLWEGMQTGSIPNVEHVPVPKHLLRAEVTFRDEPEYTAIFEGHTPHGVWAMMTFGRVGQKPNFETLERTLDQTTWNLPEGGGAVIGHGSRLNLAPDAVAFAESYISAWELLVRAARNVGGVDADSIPPCAAYAGDPVLEKMEREELQIRANLQLAYEARRRGGRHISAVVDRIAREKDPRNLAAMREAFAKVAAKG